MTGKIYRYACEGILVKKTIEYLFKLPGRIRSEIDRIIGVVFRYYLRCITKVDDNKVFFHTQESKYVCNPKYICEELLRREAPYNIVWRQAGVDRGEIPEEVKAVRLNSLEYFKEIYSSKVIITNSFLFLGAPIYLKKDQVLLETWHGSLGIKKWGAKDIKDTWRRVYALKKTAAMTTYCLSNSDLENDSMKNTFWPKTPILQLGHARNDILLPEQSELRRQVRKKIFSKYELSDDTRIVLYAPTFRDDNSLKYYDINYDALLTALEERFGGRWVCFLRFHPSLIKKNKKVLESKGNSETINVTSYTDMQEILAVADVGITDYSSWIYDFILLRRPGFIFATDIDDYDQERGFYYPMEETPFAIARTNKQLIDCIHRFDENEYLKKLEKFLVAKGCIDDGHASKRAVDLLDLIITGNLVDQNELERRYRN